MLELGYKASAEQFGPRELIDFGVLAEECGFDNVVISDHFHPWQHTGGHAPFSWAWLGAMGERTSRVRIGTSVVAPTFRYHPTIMAQAMATLEVMFPGRTFFGVGSGEALNETPSVGVDMPGPKERRMRLAEALRLMRRLWSEDYVTFDGEYYQTKAATLFDRPANGVKVYVAASGALMAGVAGRLSDGLIATSGKDMALYSEQLLPAFDKGATDAGRDPKNLDRMIEMKVSFASEDNRKWPTSVLSTEDKTGVHDPRELEARSKSVTDEALLKRWITSDDPGVHIEAIGHYVDLGFTNLVFHGPGVDQKAFIRRYGTEVLPELRKKYGSRIAA